MRRASDYVVDWYVLLCRVNLNVRFRSQARTCRHLYLFTGGIAILATSPDVTASGAVLRLVSHVVPFYKLWTLNLRVAVHNWLARWAEQSIAYAPDDNEARQNLFTRAVIVA